MVDAVWVGIDVSKAELQVALGPSGEQWRSPSGATIGGGVGAAVAASRAPHLGQNAKSAGASKLQPLHVMGRGDVDLLGHQ